MKKRLLLPACLVCVTILAQAQTKTFKAPPPPPEPPKVEILKSAPPPAMTTDGHNRDFFKNNPSIKEINRNGDEVILLFKNNSTERYNLANEKEKKAFIEKYGAIPEPPPPPPAPAPPKIKKLGK